MSNIEKMSNGSEEKGRKGFVAWFRKWKKFIIGFILGLAVMFGILSIINWNRWFNVSNQQVVVTDGNVEDWTGNRDTYSGEKNTDTIDIPGFDTLTFKANTTSQSVNFYNPEQNSCYFKMSLILSDGTKLWESGLVAPGKAIYNININKALSAGTYNNALLRYECFSMNDQRQLNGNEIKFTLNVKE